MASEWQLLGMMALGGVGVGATAVFLVENDGLALLPFVTLPALAMWYAYGAAAQHVEAVERNKWLVTLGGLLAQHGQGTTTLEESAEAIRQIVGAPQMLVLQPGTDGGARDWAPNASSPRLGRTRVLDPWTPTSCPTAGRPAS